MSVMGVLSAFEVDRVEIGGLPGIAVMDRSAAPNTLVVLAVGAGTTLSGRWFIDPGRPLQDAVNAVDMQGADKNFPLSRCLEYLGLRGECGFGRTIVDRFFRLYPEGSVDRETVYDAARSKLMSRGLQEVAASIDAEALEALSCVSEFSNQAYAFYADRSQVGIYRRQAAAAYPLLANEIAGKILVKRDVDNQRSPVDRLSMAFGTDAVGCPLLSKTLIKKLTGRRLRDGGMPMPALISALSVLPIDWFPKDDAEWEAFTKVADAFLRPIMAETSLRPDVILSGVGGKWQVFAERLAKAYADTRVPDGLDEEARKAWRPTIDPSKEAMEGAAGSLLDVVTAFRNLIVLPMMAASEGASPVVGQELVRIATEASARFLLDGMNLPKMLELSRHWHTQEHNIYAAAGRDDDKLEQYYVAEDGWPPLCDVLVAPNGLTILPLTDPRAIADEGREGPDENGVLGLDHCVGGYAEHCRAGRSHILSIRKVDQDGSYTRVTTVEIRDLSADGTKFRIAQNYAVGNTTAPKEAKEAMDWLREMVELNQIKLNVDGVMSYLAGKSVKQYDVEAYCGYDWREEGAIEKALEPWRAYFPKRARDLSLDELRQQPEFEETLNHMAPQYRVMSIFA